MAGIPFGRGRFASRLSRLGGKLVLRGSELIFEPAMGLGRRVVIDVDAIVDVVPAGERPARMEIRVTGAPPRVFMVADRPNS